MLSSNRRPRSHRRRRLPRGAKAGGAEAPQSAWVKLCEAGQTVSKDKDGKEVKQDLKICMTMHERLDGNSGMTVVSAAVRQVEGQDKTFFMIMVPTEVVLKPGMRATFIPPDLWDKAAQGRAGRRQAAEGIPARLHDLPPGRMQCRDRGLA